MVPMIWEISAAPPSMTRDSSGMPPSPVTTRPGLDLLEPNSPIARTPTLSVSFLRCGAMSSGARPGRSSLSGCGRSPGHAWSRSFCCPAHFTIRGGRLLLSPVMRALFPGSFDPVTQGHKDILRRAALLFDEVVVCVMFNSNKTGRSPVTERLDRLCAAATDLSNVTVDSHTGGLLVDYCRRVGIDVVIRGVRGVADLDYEMPMARMNHELAGVETFFISADPALAHISSTLVTTMSQQDPVPK
ncbi:pantetheine-phosphate adenylyltransferase [Streptomyces sp. NBC_01369]|uniref:pantetheine-phosphate adenylyltransferase n=2 Tax=Streptomyces TaxID=1883 RepID=UPI003D80AF61